MQVTSSKKYTTGKTILLWQRLIVDKKKTTGINNLKLTPYGCIDNIDGTCILSCRYPVVW